MLLGNITGNLAEISAHSATFLCDPMRPLPTQVLLILSLHAAGAEEPVSFNDAIQPLMSETCYHCHGPDSGTREPKDEPLRLDRPEFALAKRSNGKPAIVPGRPEDSLIIQLMRSTDPDKRMPPPKAHRQLKPAELELIERWVREGAKFEEHWAFVPPVKKSPPRLDGDT